ncbi:MAG: UDP-N-acetyl-D-glucosamine dehydrogenase [Candidatus Marinimicrobia bacterium]|nr:UDP-N-acetyl-D-glucosamine dehydrogenase [Candidatus Neomarinimicrobiota bacterium]|tara:strand:- start:85474 stop:86787 length:1314 start_codon:yes stop_codon:yes gene_type:complete
MSLNLKEKISDKSAEIGIIGLGYVGLPLAYEFASSGFIVTGIDIDEKRVNSLNVGENYISDVNDEKFRELVHTKKFKATTDFSRINDLHAISICVPTPLNKLKDPDMSYINSALDQIVRYLHGDLLIILESTTYPGSTREVVLPKLQSSNYKIGQDIFLCFSPERVDPGNKTYNISNTPKVIGGVTQGCTELGKLLYEKIVNEVIPVSSPESAEMVKLLENTYRSINIGLANEVAIMCEKLGINAWEVINAASTKPFGFMKFTPGPGLGGHCIPIDPHYLSWKMKTLDYKARFIELASEINTAMPQHVVKLIGKGLNRIQKPINGSKILILGIAYKKDIDDVRESPALDVMKILELEGADVDFYDPFITDILWNSNRRSGLTSLSGIESFDIIVVLTDHSDVNYDLVLKHSTLIVDTRNVFPDNNDEKIISLGVGDF